MGTRLSHGPGLSRCALVVGTLGLGGLLCGCNSGFIEGEVGGYTFDSVQTGFYFDSNTDGSDIRAVASDYGFDCPAGAPSLAEMSTDEGEEVLWLAILTRDAQESPPLGDGEFSVVTQEAYFDEDVPERYALAGLQVVPVNDDPFVFWAESGDVSLYRTADTVRFEFAFDFDEGALEGSFEMTECEAVQYQVF